MKQKDIAKLLNKSQCFVSSKCKLIIKEYRRAQDNRKYVEVGKSIPDGLIPKKKEHFNHE